MVVLHVSHTHIHCVCLRDNAEICRRDSGHTGEKVVEYGAANDLDERKSTETFHGGRAGEDTEG